MYRYINEFKFIFWGKSIEGKEKYIIVFYMIENIKVYSIMFRV